MHGFFLSVVDNSTRIMGLLIAVRAVELNILSEDVATLSDDA